MCSYCVNCCSNVYDPSIYDSLVCAIVSVSQCTCNVCNIIQSWLYHTMPGFFLYYCSLYNYVSLFLVQDASLVLQTVQTILSTYLSNLESQPFTNVEVALRMLYLVGEAITDKVSLYRHVVFTF